jgi:hypothetical protein
MEPTFQVQDARYHAAIIDTRIAKPALRQTQLDQRSNAIQGQNSGIRPASRAGRPNQNIKVRT